MSQRDRVDSVWGIVVAGGSGARFGQRKQLLELAGRRVADRALDALRPFVDGLIVVIPADLVGAPGGDRFEADAVVAGGDSRSASVRAGLAHLPATVTHVLVHDAARPLADPDLIQRVVAALSQGDAVVPVVAVADTLRRVSGGPADRADFVAVQTPQGFGIDALRAAHSSGAEATDDASLIDACGGRVVHVEGNPRNFKITVAHDLIVAEALLRAQPDTAGMA